MQVRSMVFWMALLSVAPSGGSAQSEPGDADFASREGASLTSPPSALSSYDKQVKTLLMRAGVKIPSDEALQGQQGHDQLLQLLRLDSRDSVRANAGSLLIQHPLLVPASLETLVPLFERIPASRAEERNHLPRAWLEQRESGAALLLVAPDRMAALLGTSPTEDTQTIAGLRDAILGQHGDIDAQRRLRDELLECVSDAPESVDCIISAPVRGLGTLALVQERWDTASPAQRAALIRWIYPGYLRFDSVDNRKARVCAARLTRRNVPDLTSRPGWIATL